MCWNGWKMKLIFFFDLYFSSYGENSSNIDHILSIKMTMYTWKMQNVLKRMKNQFPNLCVFLVFELWPKKNFVPKDAQCYETDLCMLWTVMRFLVLEIWSILYSNFVVNWGLGRIQKKIMLRGLRHRKAPGSWGASLRPLHFPPEVVAPGPGCFRIKSP